MTTIITDGRLIASDSRCTFGDEIGMRPTTKMMHHAGRIFAVAGVVGLVDVLAKWWVDGRPVDGVPKILDATNGWSMIVIEAGPRFYYVCNSSLHPVEVDPPFGIGTGAVYALGAVHAGADARRAVEIACLLDKGSGGPIRVIDIVDAVGVDLRSSIAFAAE